MKLYALTWFRVFFKRTTFVLGEILKLSDSVYPCETCGRMYNHAVLKQCPGCASQAESEPNKRETQGALFKDNRDEKGHIELINAQAKTTHAIRAVVLILQFFMLNLFLFGVWVIFGISDNIFLLVINCLLWLFGAIRTLYLARVEFDKSA